MPVEVSSTAAQQKLAHQHISGAVAASTADNRFLVKWHSPNEGGVASGSYSRNQLKLPPAVVNDASATTSSASSSAAEEDVAAATASGRPRRATAGRNAGRFQEEEEEDDDDIPELIIGNQHDSDSDDEDDETPELQRRNQAAEDDEEEGEDFEFVASEEEEEEVAAEEEEEATSIDVNDSGDTAEINRILNPRSRNRNPNNEDEVDPNEEFDADEFFRSLGDDIDPVSLRLKTVSPFRTFRSHISSRFAFCNATGWCSR